MLNNNQINALHKLDTTTALQVFAEIIERLGIVSFAEYAKIHGVPLRTVYYFAEVGRIKTVEFCGKKYIVIN
jgi:hypothetical protein